MNTLKDLQVQALSSYPSAITRAKAIIREGGGTVENFEIVYPGDDKRVLEAIEFLVHDLDFDFYASARERHWIKKVLGLSLAELVVLCLGLVVGVALLIFVISSWR